MSAAVVCVESGIAVGGSLVAVEFGAMV